MMIVGQDGVQASLRFGRERAGDVGKTDSLEQAVLYMPLPRQPSYSPERPRFLRSLDPPCSRLKRYHNTSSDIEDEATDKTVDLLYLQHHTMPSLRISKTLCPVFLPSYLSRPRFRYRLHFYDRNSLHLDHGFLLCHGLPVWD